MKTKSENEGLELIILIPAMLAIAFACSNCSVRVESEWFGKTAKDNRAITPELAQKSVKAQERY